MYNLHKGLDIIVSQDITNSKKMTLLEIVLERKVIQVGIETNSMVLIQIKKKIRLIVVDGSFYLK